VYLMRGPELLRSELIALLPRIDKDQFLGRT
jgi:hypothetical protein